MSDEHERRHFARVRQQSMELLGNMQGVAWGRAGFAPAAARTIVCADACHLRYLRLYPGPIDGCAITHCFENHSRAVVAHAANVKTMPVDLHEPPRRSEAALVSARCQFLHARRGGSQNDDHTDRSSESARKAT